jgi:hypothetical protein
MASADLLRKEEEFYSSLFDSAKGNPPIPFTRKEKKTPLSMLTCRAQPPNPPLILVLRERRRRRQVALAGD